MWTFDSSITVRVLIKSKTAHKIFSGSCHFEYAAVIAGADLIGCSSKKAALIICVIMWDAFQVIFMMMCSRLLFAICRDIISGKNMWVMNCVKGKPTLPHLIELCNAVVDHLTMNRRELFDMQSKHKEMQGL